MSIKRTQLGLLAALLAPITYDTEGPLCLTCGRVVDGESLVEGFPGETTFCKVLVRHHNAEELRTFDMGSKEWDHRDLKRLMQGARWFDPNEQGEGVLRATVPAAISG